MVKLQPVSSQLKNIKNAFSWTFKRNPKFTDNYNIQINICDNILLPGTQGGAAGFTSAGDNCIATPGTQYQGSSIDALHGFN